MNLPGIRVTNSKYFSKGFFSFLGRKGGFWLYTGKVPLSFLVKMTVFGMAKIRKEENLLPARKNSA